MGYRSRSFKLVTLKSLSTVSYSHSTVTMTLSCIISEITRKCTESKIRYPTRLMLLLKSVFNNYLLAIIASRYTHVRTYPIFLTLLWDDKTIYARKCYLRKVPTTVTGCKANVRAAKYNREENSVLINQSCQPRQHIKKQKTEE